MSGNPQLVNVVTWGVMNGFRHFKRLHVTREGLFAQAKIPQYDFVAVVPASFCLSVHTVNADSTFPLSVTPRNYAEELPWWSDVNWGIFGLIAFLTKEKLIGAGGLSSYLNLQCPADTSTVIGQHGAAMQELEEYRDSVAKVVQLCQSSDPSIDEESFHRSFLQCYCLMKIHGVPLWSSQGVGHPWFEQSLFGASPKHGDVTALLPVMDLANHSAIPNASIGHPDSEMVSWLAQEKNIPQTEHLFALQALKDIEVGDPVTIDKNVNYGFDPDTFQAWFGYPYN